MQVVQKLKKLLMVVTLLAGLGLGYLAINVTTSCTADAFICLCVNPQCTGTSNGMMAALTEITASVVVLGAGWVGGLLVAYVALIKEFFDMLIKSKIEATQKKVVQGFETLLWYNLRPALQAQTEQKNVDDSAQALAVSSFEDAAEVSQTALAMEVAEVESKRENSLNENGCPPASVAGGFARANLIRQAYGRAAPVTAVAGRSALVTPGGIEVLERSSNAVGSPSANGRASDQKARLANYQEKYCDPNANAGKAGCTAAGSLGPNADLDVAGNVFNKDTIDITTAEVDEVVNDMIANIAEPFVKNSVPPSILLNTSGQNVMLAGESYKAKRQTIYDALYHIVARRIPASSERTSTLLNEISSEAGLTPDMLPAKASYHHMMKVMMKDRFRSGKFSTQQIDEPENNSRELVIQQGYQAMHWNDTLDLLDRYALVLAAQAGTEAVEARPFDPMYDQQSTRRQ